MEETFRQPFPTFRENTENLSLNYHKVASIVYIANLSGSVENLNWWWQIQILGMARPYQILRPKLLCKNIWNWTPFQINTLS